MWEGALSVEFLTLYNLENLKMARVVDVWDDRRGKGS